MERTTQSDLAPDLLGDGRAVRLHDLLEEYVRWREACASVSVAYETWRGARRRDQEVAFWTYSAALDREEESARAYEKATARFAD